MAVDPYVVLRQGQSLPRGHPQLHLDEVDPRHRLGHRVLHLQASVHLQEGEVAGASRGHDVLHGPRRGVAHRAGKPHRRGADLLAQAGVKQRGGSLLDDLLVAPLQGALALPEVDDAAMLVGEDLHLDVPRGLHVALDEQAIVTERRHCFAARSGDRRAHVVTLAQDAHPLPAAAGRRLEERREADLAHGLNDVVVAHVGVVASGHDRDARGYRGFLRGDFVAHCVDDLR